MTQAWRLPFLTTSMSHPTSNTIECQRRSCPLNVRIFLFSLSASHAGFKGETKTLQ